MIKQKTLLYRLIINVLFIASFGMLWFLTAFRSENIGNDTQNYIDYFYRFLDNGVSEDIGLEYGYQVFNVLIGLFTEDSHCFLISVSSFLYIGTGWYIHKYSKNILVTTVLFFCYGFPMYTNILRQSLAMMISLYAYQCIKQRKKLCALVLILLAMSFHYSAIVCVILFIGNYIRIKKNYVIAGSIVLALLSVFGIMNTILIELPQRYANYFYSHYAFGGGGAITIELVRTFFIMIIAFDAKEKYSLLHSNVNDNLDLWCVSLMLLLGTLGYSMNLFNRITSYFLLIMMVEYPNFLISKKYYLCNFSIFIFATFSLILFMLIQMYRPEWNSICPYTFFGDS